MPDNSTEYMSTPKKLFNTQLVIFLVTLVFLAGVAYGNFVTKSEFENYKKNHEEFVQKNLDKIESKFDKILIKLEEIQIKQASRK